MMMLVAVLLLAIALPAVAQESAAPLLRISASPLDAIAWTPDGTRLVGGGRDNLVRLWDATTGAQIAMLAGHTGWVTRVAVSPDGSMIASGSQDTTVRLWDAANFTQIAALTHHTGSITGVAFSPDGLLLATTSLDGTIWIGDARTGATLNNLPAYNGAAWGVAFSPDSRTLAAGSADGAIWLWGLYDSSLRALRGHTGLVSALDFSDDGTQLISASWDRTARIWEVAGGTELSVWNNYASPFTGAAFAANGTVITGGLDGALRLWFDEAQAAVLSGASALAGIAVLGDRVAAAGVNGVIEVWQIPPDLTPAAPTIPVTLSPTAALTIVQVVSLLPTSAPTVDVRALIPVFTAPVLPTAMIANPLPTNEAAEETIAAAPAQPAAQPTASGGASLAIPTVNIFSPIKVFPLDGVSWAIDPWERQVGYLQGTGWVDRGGNIALGGHSEFPDGTPGIFAGLYQLNIGDPILLTVDGVERRYTVRERRVVRYDDLSVVYPTPNERLTLITCDLPSYNEATGEYEDRLVIIAEP